MLLSLMWLSFKFTQYDASFGEVSEHRLRVSENWRLRKIFLPKRDEVTGGWRELRGEELYYLYAVPVVGVVK